MRVVVLFKRVVRNRIIQWNNFVNLEYLLVAIIIYIVLHNVFYFVFLNKLCEPNLLSLLIMVKYSLWGTWIREENCLQRDTSHSTYSKKQIFWNCLSHIFPQKHVHYCYHSTHLSHALIWITNVHWGPVIFLALKELDIRIVKGWWHISTSPVVHSIVLGCHLYINLFIYISLSPFSISTSRYEL